MPVPGLDPQKCLARNRRCARMGLNAVPVRLAVGVPPPIDTNDPAVEAGMTVVSARGSLPRTPAAALERINAIRPKDAPALAAEDVHIVFCEAGNSNFIQKYFMFLGESTQRNIARRASRSIAFMNSHRTGGMSTEAELPYGRTFAGRFEQMQDPKGRTFSRTLLGVYMLRGQRPNGAGGPSTDDLYDGIRAGTIFDVSLGILGGEEVCNVCGQPLDQYDSETGDPLCSHMPGTKHGMTTDEVVESLKRGVPGGVCSFTLEDATAYEVSPVFDGAVPGAGFRKVMKAARARTLSAADLADAQLSFGRDAGRAFRPHPHEHDRGPTMPVKKITSQMLLRLAEQLGVEVEDAPPGPPPVAPVAATAPSAPAAAAPAPAPAPSPAPATLASHADTVSVDERLRALESQNRALTDTLNEERQARQNDAVAQRRQTVLAQAENWADTQLRLQRVTPAQRDEAMALYAQAAVDDATNPAVVAYRDPKNTPCTGSRLDALSAFVGHCGPHGFATEQIAPRDVLAAPIAPDQPIPGPQPLVSLGLLSHQTAADPIGDAMLAANGRWQDRRSNGRHAAK